MHPYRAVGDARSNYGTTGVDTQTNPKLRDNSPFLMYCKKKGSAEFACCPGNIDSVDLYER